LESSTKKKIFKGTIIYFVLEKLLTPTGNVETKILILCEILSSIGIYLERANRSSVQRLDSLFKELETCYSSKTLTNRAKFAILDVMDLRGEKWSKPNKNIELLVEVNKAKLTKEEEIDKIYCKFTRRDLERKNGFNGTML